MLVQGGHGRELADGEKAKLRRSLGRLDVFFFLVCTLVGVDGLGALATRGGAAFTWMIGSVIVLAVPSALLIAEMGAAWTDEGGPCIWVRMALGRLPAAVNNFFYWVSNPVWVGGTLAGTAAGALAVFFHGGSGLAAGPMYVIGLLFIWCGVILTIFSVGVSKWVVAAGAVARFALFGLFTVVVLVYGIEHGFHGVAGNSFVPTFSGFTALVPLILFSLVGFELPSAAGEELENPVRDVPAGIARSVLAAGALYGLPVLGILVVLPAGQGSGRAMAISCLDGAGRWSSSARSRRCSPAWAVAGSTRRTCPVRNGIRASDGATWPERADRCWCSFCWARCAD